MRDLNNQNTVVHRKFLCCFATKLLMLLTMSDDDGDGGDGGDGDDDDKNVECLW